MALVLTSGPATEPVTVAEAKAHLRIDHDSEDVLIGSLVLTSRLHIEAALGMALLSQTWKLALDRFPADGIIALPLSPVASVASVRVLSADNSALTLDASAYEVDAASRPARVVRGAGAYWPPPGKRANGVEVVFTAGFGTAAADVPAPIRQALLLLVAHWYEHRDPIEIGASETRVPATVSALLEPYKVKRL
jgi:uncharacterized phiE125 gp8 family phage protein